MPAKEWLHPNCPGAIKWAQRLHTRQEYSNESFDAAQRIAMILTDIDRSLGRDAPQSGAYSAANFTIAERAVNDRPGGMDELIAACKVR